MTIDERERLQGLHMTLEAALEQLTYAQQHATQGTEIGSPPTEEIRAIERLLGEVTLLRNQIRDRLMKLLAKPALNIIK
jgi:hypothetical protein